MIKVIAKNFVKEENIKDVLELADELIKSTIKEEGCINYEMYQDEKNPSILIMIEEWETMENLNRHMSSEHFQTIVPKMNEFMTEKPEMNLCKKVL